MMYRLSLKCGPLHPQAKSKARKQLHILPLALTEVLGLTESNVQLLQGRRTKVHQTLTLEGNAIPTGWADEASDCRREAP